MEIRQRLAIRCVRTQRFKTLKVKQAAVHFIRTGLGDDVDDATGGATKLGVGAGRDYLEFLDCIQSDIDGRTLTTDLLAKKSVVIIAAIQTDVVECSALAGKVDLVAIRPLHDADAGSQGQQIFEFAAEHGSPANGSLV